MLAGSSRHYLSRSSQSLSHSFALSNQQKWKEDVWGDGKREATKLLPVKEEIGKKERPDQFIASLLAAGRELSERRLYREKYMNEEVKS